jgi:hypothetical protein
MSDDLEQRFADALRRRADAAPAAQGLARAARARLARRRRGQLAGVALGAAVAVAGGLAVAGGGPAPSPVPATGPATGPTSGSDDATVDELPAGWRWESYGGVEVGVPGDWADANGSQLIGQWCVDGQEPPDGFVGRPGGSTGVGCPQRPGPTLAVVGPYVDLAPSIEGAADQPVAVDGGVATQVVDGVRVSVQAPEPLRERILATVRTVEVDVNGCATTDPFSHEPLAPPSPASDVTGLTSVTAVSACRYALDNDWVDGQLRLLSSERLEGAAASAVVEAIGNGADGGGPDTPHTCLPEGAWGDEGLVLLVEHDGGTARVHVRYQGCDHNGFDDGTRTHALTEEAIRPLLSGSNTVTTGLSSAAHLVWDLDR